MARTVDPAAHAKRRDAYVDAALRLIQTKGYDQLSVQDVIDEVGTSKGAFFHYFDSKAALLAAVIERMVETAFRRAAPIAADPSLNAAEKLEQILGGIAEWKMEQPEFQPAALLGLMRIWYSDENTIVLQRMRAAAAERLTPLLTDIVRQGAAEGTMSVSWPEGTATVITSLMLALQDVAVRLFIGRQDGTVSFETVSCTLAAYLESLERILGVKELEWPLAQAAALQLYFGTGAPDGAPSADPTADDAIASAIHDLPALVQRDPAEHGSAKNSPVVTGHSPAATGHPHTEGGNA